MLLRVGGGKKKLEMVYDDEVKKGTIPASALYTYYFCESISSKRRVECGESE